MTSQLNSSRLTLPRNATATSQILSSRRGQLTNQQLHQKADAFAAEAIATACLWDRKADTPLGDYRVAAFSIQPSRSVYVFVRLISCPNEPATMLVTSGEHDRPTRNWLPADLPATMRALELEMDVESGFYRRELRIRSARDVRRTARLVVDILHTGFNYRGLVPLDVEIQSYGRATAEFVYTCFAPADIVQIAAKLGYSARMSQAEGLNDATAVVELRKGKTVAEVTLGNPSEGDPGLYTSGFLGSRTSPRAAMEGARKALRRDQPRLRPNAWRVGVTLHFEGGVTAEWLARRIQEGMRLVATSSSAGVPAEYPLEI